MIRSSGVEKKLILSIFVILLQELKIKLDITKDGIGPNKIISEVYSGSDIDIKRRRE